MHTILITDIFYPSYPASMPCLPIRDTLPLFLSHSNSTKTQTKQIQQDLRVLYGYRQHILGIYRKLLVFHKAKTSFFCSPWQVNRQQFPKHTDVDFANPSAFCLYAFLQHHQPDSAHSRVPSHYWLYGLQKGRHRWPIWDLTCTKAPESSGKASLQNSLVKTVYDPVIIRLRGASIRCFKSTHIGQHYLATST